ncbi:hypothetical protein AB0395_47935, partial [Streptosporangium sp. NPDC051023]|uniref:hypothetical protein n=1 Tax=Streptosporangium sp. NPDC051023 TaxID=3155410 RepID=UPI00344E1659
MADVVWYERGEDLSEPTPEEELDFLRRERVRWDSMPVTYRYTAVGPESGPDGALVSVEVPATEVGAWAPDRPGQRLMR